MSILSLSNMDVNWYTDVPKDVTEILLESVMISVAHSTKTLLDAKIIRTSNSERVNEEKILSNDNNDDNDSNDANNNNDIIKESKRRHNDDSVSNNNRNSFSLPDDSSILQLKSVSNILYGFGALDLKWKNLDLDMQEKFLTLLALLLDGEDPVYPLSTYLKNDKRSVKSTKNENTNENESEDDNGHEDANVGVRLIGETALSSSNLKFLINSLARVGLDFASSSSSSSYSSSSSSYSTHSPHLESADEDKPQLKLMLKLRHLLTSSFIRFAIPNESLKVEVEVEDISSNESAQNSAYAEPKESDVMTSSDFFSSLLSLGSITLQHLLFLFLFLFLCLFYIIVLLSLIVQIHFFLLFYLLG